MGGAAWAAVNAKGLSVRTELLLPHLRRVGRGTGTRCGGDMAAGRVIAGEVLGRSRSRRGLQGSFDLH